MAAHSPEDREPAWLAGIGLGKKARPPSDARVTVSPHQVLPDARHRHILQQLRHTQDRHSRGAASEPGLSREGAMQLENRLQGAVAILRPSDAPTGIDTAWREHPVRIPCGMNGEEASAISHARPSLVHSGAAFSVGRMAMGTAAGQYICPVSAHACAVRKPQLEVL